MGIIEDFTESAGQRLLAQKWFQTLRREHKGTQLTARLTGCLYDGLTYGNWPWKDAK